MKSAHIKACATERGQAHPSLPPFMARGRRFVMALVMIAGTALGGACSSSAASTRSTPGSAAPPIPPPFEVGQQIGSGDLTVMVDTFRRTGDSLTAHVVIVNQATHAVPLVPAHVFSIFYEAARHAPSRVVGLAGSIAPHGRESVTLDFAVPATYQYPLLWFSAPSATTRDETVVLRGNHS